MPEDLQQWQNDRQAELSAEDSWLGLAGLFWLEPGVNRVGCGDDCLVCLPSGRAHLGDLHWQADEVVWQPVGGPAQRLQTDRDGPPAVIEHENWSFFIVDRDKRLAARLRDRAWAAKRSFASLDYFPFDPNWVIEADWLLLTPAQSLEVPNVSGDLQVVEVGYQAVFSLAGQAVTLLPMSVGATEVFFVFRDRSSGKETYGAGRFLKVPAPVNGKIRLDFNRAYNPPCAFTPFATCPLPPPENWLPFSVPAGEKKWAGWR